MRVSRKWIEQFVDISDISVDDLIKKLTMAGFEVESTIKLWGNKDVIVGIVKEVEPFKTSDHLKICKVFDGKYYYSVVCGASNVKAGLLVPFAKPGAKLFNNTEIRETEIKGMKSEGMICSSQELGIEEKSNGIMVLNNELKLGEDVNKIFELPDVLLDISITPNRGDCLSIRGLSREIAAIYDRPFKEISFELKENVSEEIDKLTDVVVADKEGCPLYVGRVIKNIKITSAPTFMEVRLKKVGLNSINNVVDITNYVLIEVGQPLHTFDLDKIKEKIIVRKGKDGESIKLLDGRIINIESSVLVICDVEKALAIAGIMGGEESGIANKTKNIFLESAFFSPILIRKTAKKLNLSTDASYRFERGVDAGETENVANYAAFLLHKYAKGDVTRGIIKRSSVHEKEKKRVLFSFNNINNLLGYTIDPQIQKSIFFKLNMNVLEEKNNLFVEVPTYRRDIELEADLAEEIARIYGYENIPEMSVKIDANGQPPNYIFRQIRDIRGSLKSLGFYETINYSFIDEKYLKQFYSNKKFIKLKNPISEDMNVLRVSIFPSLIKNIISNLRKGHTDIRLFEIAKIFGDLNVEGLPLEEIHLSFSTTENFWPLNWLQKGNTETFYILKGIMDNIFSSLKLDYTIKRTLQNFLHPGKSGDIIMNESFVGFIGELHPSFYELLDISTKIYIAEISLTKILELSGNKEIKYEKYSIYPYVNKDLSFIIDEKASVSEIINLIYTISPLIKSVMFYDLYKDESIGIGKKSLTFRIIFSSFSKTLTDKETNEILETIINRCKKEFNITLR
jgi:phenylalanyl-tRNA synthetase beta chain